MLLHRRKIVKVSQIMTTIPASFVAFDLETTGFNPPGSRIIEIGAVKVVNWEVVETYQKLVNPGCLIPANITILTGIDDRMVFSAFPIEMILPEFLDFVQDFPLAAHNIQFDMGFIRYDARRMGYTLANTLVDTVPLCRRCFPKLTNHKLGTVARHLNALGDAEHRGLQDAMVVARILQYANQNLLL